jgi:hypothetical protein
MKPSTPNRTLSTHVVSIGEGEHSRSVRHRLRPRRQVLRGCSHRHFHPRVFGQRTPAHERHTCIRSGGAAHIGECCHPIAEEHHSTTNRIRPARPWQDRPAANRHWRCRRARAPFTLGKHWRKCPTPSRGRRDLWCAQIRAWARHSHSRYPPTRSPARGSAKASKAFVTGPSVMSVCSYRATLISPPFPLPSSMSALISSGAAIPNLPTKRVRTLRSCRVARTRCYTVTSSEGSSARRGVVRIHTNMGLNSGRLGAFSGILRTPPAVANCSCPLPPRTCGTETQDRGLGEPSLGRRLVPACHRRRGAEAADFVPQRRP